MIGWQRGVGKSDRDKKIWIVCVMKTRKQNGTRRGSRDSKKVGVTDMDGEPFQWSHAREAYAG